MDFRLTTRLAACLLLARLALPQDVAPAKPADTSVKAVLAAAGKYVTEYQKKLSYLLADETYNQHVFNYAGHETADRTTKAEFFITFLPAQHEWMAVRDVTEVDGEPVEHHDDMAALIAKPTAGPVLAERNSRFNIGAIERNFSEPTLPLLVLDDRYRAHVKFERVRTEPSADRTLVVLSFKEHEDPTMIHRPDGQPVYSNGELVIDAQNGEVVRTTINLTGTVLAEMTTTYEPDVRLGLLVPTLLQERYEHKDNYNTEVVTGAAHYANFRKFGATVTIK